MNQDYSISIYLDKRRTKSNGKFPVRLRVFVSNPRKQKLYPTKFDFTKKEFESIWETNKPRKEYKDIRLKLQAIENKANEIADKIIPFAFTQFEKKLFRKKGDGIKVPYHYKERIADYKKQNRISTADSYNCSEKALKKFVEEGNKNYSNLTLLDINKNWLLDFEHFMTNSGRSITTVGIYLRPLRAIFNKAIEEGEIEKEFYPFGKRKYQIPTSKKVKKALSKEQMKKLFLAVSQNEEQEKAKDFWFFSYNCNGMNIKDIAQLKYKNITNNKIVFYRAKTLFTSKTDLKPITVYLNDYSNKIINRYSNPEKLPEKYIFPILKGDETPEQQQVKIKNFTRYINQHLKKLCKANDLPEEISTYWARHSFATLSVQKGVSLEFMQESLGHKNMATTQAYFAGFDDETKKEFAEGLMDFD
ncbi:site-specific integrase [Aquimarina sp. I32.4]|uniref:tyrosine-type recombinase/integrase n=1 Tax=Aquimarina sp. I32.4 TaxID=2053903 RepID=UPI000CDF1067|nr:site-specific integrase [Aquimarina sp. I32.4]